MPGCKKSTPGVPKPLSKAWRTLLGRCAQRTKGFPTRSARTSTARRPCNDLSQAAARSCRHRRCKVSSSKWAKADHWYSALWKTSEQLSRGSRGLLTNVCAQSSTVRRNQDPEASPKQALRHNHTSPQWTLYTLREAVCRPKRATGAKRNDGQPFVRVEITACAEP